MILQPTLSTLFPYTTLFRSDKTVQGPLHEADVIVGRDEPNQALLEARVMVRRLLAQDRQRQFEQGKAMTGRSEEHTSELQSRPHLVCRLLLEKKNYHRLYMV